MVVLSCCKLAVVTQCLLSERMLVLHWDYVAYVAWLIVELNNVIVVAPDMGHKALRTI